MPQFNAESLARVLTQVEREVLVEAVEKAGIDPLFTADRGSTIDEMAEWFNFLSNVLILGPSWAEVKTRELAGDAIEIPIKALERLKDAFGWLLNLDGKLDALIEILQEIKLTVERVPRPEPDIDLEAMIPAIERIELEADVLNNWNLRYQQSQVLRNIVINLRASALVIRRAL